MKVVVKRNEKFVMALTSKYSIGRWVRDNYEDNDFFWDIQNLYGSFEIPFHGRINAMTVFKKFLSNDEMIELRYRQIESYTGEILLNLKAYGKAYWGGYVFIRED